MFGGQSSNVPRYPHRRWVFHGDKQLEKNRLQFSLEPNPVDEVTYLPSYSCESNGHST